MTGKNRSNTLDDVKMLIVAGAVTLTLGLWNVFAAIGREDIAQPAYVLTEPATMPEPALSQDNATPDFTGTILFGGVAPQPRVVVRSGGGGGGGGPVTQTRSS
jgi:hypothetical protein